MKFYIIFVFLFFLQFYSDYSFSQDKKSELFLTIYNQNFAVVKERLNLNLKKGETIVRNNNVTNFIEPSSVILSDSVGKKKFQILEQTYRPSIVNQNYFLFLNEGKTIDFEVRNNDKVEKIKGKIISSGFKKQNFIAQNYYRREVYPQSVTNFQTVIEIDGQIRFALPGIPLFPKLEDDTLFKPQIEWIIKSEQDQNVNADLSYVSNELNWSASYNVIAPQNGDDLEFIGWATIENNSGKHFQNATLKLISGELNKINESNHNPYNSFVIPRASSYDYAGQPKPVMERNFDEYHLYELTGKTTIKDQETKQVEFLRAQKVASKMVYVYNGAKLDLDQYRNYSPYNIRNQEDYGSDYITSISVMREIMNSDSNNLGIPLPKGKIKFYRHDKDGQIEFVGENVVNHTPKGELLKVYTGKAFDVTGERKRTNYIINNQENWLNESFEIRLSNHKNEKIEVRIVEKLYRWSNWEILQHSNPYLKSSSQEIEFRVQLKPEDESVVTYTVHYTW